MRKNVLIFSGAPYPAVEICECLRYNLLFNPIAASSYSNHSEFVFEDHVDGLPYIYQPEIVEKLLEVIKEKNIEFIIPTDDTVALVLTKNQDKIPAKIVCSPYKTAEMCRYKSLTYKMLRGAEYLPRVYKNIAEIDKYPVFIKPDDGQGSQGTLLVRDPEQLSDSSVVDGKVICEYLPGAEYTVDCFTDRFGQLLFCGPRSRSRLMHGITARGISLPCTDEFKEIIEDINNRIQFRGYWFAQLKRDEQGKLKLMELCTRFAGSFGVSKSLGVNFPLMALCDAAEMDTAAIVNDYQVVSDKTYIDRYKLSIDYDTVYVDYDDTITCNKGEDINPYVMAFLYQCLNKNRSLILLTRHTLDKGNDLREDMHRRAISEEMFTEIHDISWNEEKADFIKSKKAIFLDNSFAERKKVHDKVGIAVFDISNIDCLFDWR